MHINSHKLVWFLVILVLASRILGAHAHACSDGDLDCLKEAHADAIAHVSEACADETCIDTKVDAADGILVKLLDLPQELVKALGASPTPISWPELFTSFQTGVVEGSKNGITDIINMNFQDHLKYIVLDGHAYMGALWWLSEDFWEGLSDEEKRVVYDGFQHLKTITRALPMRQEIDAYKEFEDAGGEVYVPTPEEKQAFKDATSGMKDWYVQQYGDVWLTKLNNAISTCNDMIAAELQ